MDPLYHIEEIYSDYCCVFWVVTVERVRERRSPEIYVILCVHYFGSLLIVPLFLFINVTPYFIMAPFPPLIDGYIGNSKSKANYLQDCFAVIADGLSYSQLYLYIPSNPYLKRYLRLKYQMCSSLFELLPFSGLWSVSDSYIYVLSFPQ